MPVIINGSTGISGTDGSAATPAVQGTDANTGMFFPAADTIAFAEGGTEVMRIDSSGNVGINTSSPGARLTVAGNLGFTTGEYVYSYQGGTAGQVRSGFLLDGSGQTLQLFTGTNERARITSGGSLLVGTTEDLGKIASNRNDTGGWCIAARTTGAGAGLFYGGENANAVFVVYGNGASFNGPGVWGSLSDIKLKDNIVDATPKLAQLNQVRVVNYSLKSDPGQKLIGVIAQEVEQLFPGLVHEVQDKDADGTDLGTTTKSVKYSVFVPMLIKAVQELTAKLEAAEARIATLEAR